jgi:hypothetical protein
MFQAPTARLLSSQRGWSRLLGLFPVASYLPPRAESSQKLSTVVGCRGPAVLPCLRRGPSALALPRRLRRRSASPLTLTRYVFSSQPSFSPQRRPPPVRDLAPLGRTLPRLCRRPNHHHCWAALSPNLPSMEAGHGSCPYWSISGNPKS